jgi:thiamine-monophosphate kinase
MEWINFLKRNTPKGSDVLTGIGDDCAQVKLGREKFLLKSDLFIENIHFKLKKISYQAIGMRAVSRVLSDFASCGGTPKFLGISIGLPDYLDKKYCKDIFNGVIFLSKKYNFYLVGGDTSRSKMLFLDVWGLGLSKKFVKRNTAKSGDYIFLTGPLGARKFNESFTPRIKEAQYLSGNFKINSMIDVSDGFTLDLYRILRESNKGAFLCRKAIPITTGEADLYRGEDYELIFTVDRSEKKINLLKSKFHLVGTIMERDFGYQIEHNDRLKNVKIKGYTHF